MGVYSYGLKGVVAGAKFVKDIAKNIKALDRAEGKLKTGREMMREGQKERPDVVRKMGYFKKGGRS